jgi:hypothetical protein
MTVEDRLRELEQKEDRARWESRLARRAASEAYNVAGRALLEAGKHAEALLQFEQAREIDEEMGKEDPEDTSAREALAATQNNAGDALRGSGKPDEARRRYDAARSLLTALIKPGAFAPGEESRQRELARSYAALADLEPDDAKRAEWRLERAAALLGADDYLTAADATQDAAKEKLTPAQRYQLASILSRCAAAASDDPKRPLPLREKQVEAWSRQAIELLRQADRAGYFKEHGRFAPTMLNPDFEVLRGRADFQRWLAGL